MGHTQTRGEIGLASDPLFFNALAVNLGAPFVDPAKLVTRFHREVKSQPDSTSRWRTILSPLLR